jgi:hypothetical protein
MSWLDKYSDETPKAQFGKTMFKSPSMVDYEQPSDELINDDYDMERALELGYTPDETGHWPSVDYETGEWLKSKKHHTRGMELMAYELNPELHNAYYLIENEKGKMQYIPKGKNGVEGTMAGLTDKGFDYNGAWGGQFQEGGKLKFLQPTSDKLPEGYRIPFSNPSTELAMSIGGENGEPAYLIPSFKYGRPLADPILEFRNTGEHLGGPFKTWQEADEWERTVRHPAVENRETIMFPQEKFQMGGSMPGAVGFTYARTQGIPSEGPYAKKTMPSAQTGKKIKLKDEREQAIKSSESTGVKKKNFDLEQSKENKAYINAVAAQKKEAARRAKLTKEQREREDYNAYNEERGSINKYTPETTWQRTKAVVSNPMTAAGYIARGENLPGNFQAGPRNTHDYALDWVNPLQGLVALSEIPGELSREEYLNAGLSALDALDLGVYARGAKKTLEPVVKKGMNQLGNIRTSVAPELRQGVIANGFSLNDLNPFKFKPKSDRLYTELDDKNIVEEFLGKSNITNAQKKVWTNKPEMKAKYLLEADPKNEVFSNGLSTYDIPLDHLQGSNIYKKNWLGNYKRIEPTSYFGTDWNGKDLNPFVEPQRVQYSDFIHPEQAADLAHETRNDYENLFGMSMPESPTRSNDLYPDVQNNWMTDVIERNAMKRYIYQKSMMPESWEGFYDKFRGNYDWDIKHFPERKAEFDLNFTDITPEEKNHLFNNMQVQKQGGVIKDDRGQWAHPGEITEINSNDITMEGVPYPVLGISDEGDTKLMKPGKNYKFKGKKVTEFPIAKNGINDLDAKPLQKLDNLLNFTNYNKPTGWLDKYN